MLLLSQACHRPQTEASQDVPVVCIRVRGIRGFFLGGRRGQSHFSRFSQREMLFVFLVEISILVDPKQMSVVSEKWQKKKKKKKSRLLMFIPSPLPINILLFPFYDFPSFLFHFPFFPCLFFPGKSTKISQWKNFRGALCPPARTCYAMYIKWFLWL